MAFSGPDGFITAPTEVDTLLGDSTKARESLGWHPTTPFPELVRVMVEADLKEEGLDPHKAMSGPIKQLMSSRPPS